MDSAVRIGQSLAMAHQSFDAMTAIVTGGASGIGRALGAALADAGARVILADIDGEALARTVVELCDSDERQSRLIVARELDVRDRDGVRSMVEEIAARDGAIDFFFNNAGLSMGGPTHELTGAHWDRIIDVNLLGVVNGLLAVYPLMVRQGHGHIINTASAAGLVPPPFVVPYAATKHAVAGLTAGLRPEAAMHGVRVSVLCPGAVDTPILDRLPPADLPTRPSQPVTARAYLRRLHQKPIPADKFARTALRDVSRNRAISVIPRRTKTLWYLARLSPSMAERLSGSMARIVAADLVRPVAQTGMDR